MSLIVLAPIKSDDADPYAHEQALRRLFEKTSWQQIEQQGLSHLSMLHMARFHIIEHLVPGMGDLHKVDELASKYLLFIAEIDGQQVDFYDYLFRQEPEPVIGSPEPRYAGLFVRSIWGHCVAYPDQDQIHLFRQFMQRYEIHSRLPYRAVGASRDDILRALAIKQLAVAAVVGMPMLQAPQRIDLATSYLAMVEYIKVLPSHKLLELTQHLFNSGRAVPDFQAIDNKLSSL